MAIERYKTKAGLRFKATLYMRGVRVTSKRGFLTKKDAQHWLLDEERKNSRPMMIHSGTGFSLIANQYLDDMKARRQRGTYITKRFIINQFMQFMGGDFDLEDLTTQDIDTFQRSIYEAKGGKSANRYIKELAALMNWGLRRNLFSKNPFSHVEKYPEEKFVRRIPTIEEIAAVRKVANQEERDWLDTLYYTGARLSEVAKLEWNDVDFMNNTITLWTRKRRSSNKEPRVLAIQSALLEILKRRRACAPDDQLLVFPTRNGTFQKKSAWFLRTFFQRLCERAGVPRFTAHSIRHHVATRLKDSHQATPYQIQNFLGHMNQSTTERYLHELSVDRDVVEILELPPIGKE